MKQENNATNIQILLQQAKTTAMLEDVHEDLKEIKQLNGVIEKERLQAYNTYYNQMDILKRQQNEALELTADLRKALSVIKSQGRRLTAVGVVLIFGSCSVIGKTELLGLLSKIF
jgi:hypothetical protein